MPFAKPAIAALVATAVLGVSVPSATAQDLGQYLSGYGYSPVSLGKLPTGHETLEVEINGVKGRFILDSGAGASVVHTAYAAKYGLNSPTSDDNRTATGAGGHTAISRHPIDSLSLGGAVMDQKQVSIMDLGGVVAAIKAATGEEIDGVIGQDILTRHDAVIDISKQTLYLRTTPGT